MPPCLLRALLLSVMRSDFSDCLIVDRQRLKALLRELKQVQGPRRQKAQAEFDALLERSRAAVAARRARLPRPEFQLDLPVNERRADIAALIAQHQVVIVCGETGSGKTTQLPKICIELGRGSTGMIGHTQPRRLAAYPAVSPDAKGTAADLPLEPDVTIPYPVGLVFHHCPHIAFQIYHHRNIPFGNRNVLYA